MSSPPSDGVGPETGQMNCTGFTSSKLLSITCRARLPSLDIIRQDRVGLGYDRELQLPIAVSNS